MKLSARNVLKGTVIEVKKGPVSCQVHVDIGGGNRMSSTITTEAADDLGLAPGKEVKVIVKSSEVILGTE